MQTDSRTADAPPGSAPPGGSAAGDALRPCPLCGGRVKFTGAHVCFFMSNLGIECTVCGMATRSGQYESENELREFWNEKPPNSD